MLRVRNTGRMNETRWARWLQAELEARSWRQANLVSNSGGLIKADRVSKWLSSREGPSHRLAIVTANVLGVDQAEALRAAGFVDEPVDASGGDEISTAMIAKALRGASDEQLLFEIARRLGLSRGGTIFEKSLSEAVSAAENRISSGITIVEPGFRFEDQLKGAEAREDSRHG